MAEEGFEKVGGARQRAWNGAECTRFGNMTRYAPLLALLLATGCLFRPIQGGTVYVTGFPDARPAVSSSAGSWSGTKRFFRASNNKLFCFLILFDNEPEYCRYCTEQFETSGITDVRVKTLGSMYYIQSDKPDGVGPDPDRIVANFSIDEVTTGKTKNVKVIYMLPPSSRALGRTAGFAKFKRDEIIEYCIKSVSVDMKNMSQELVRALLSAETNGAANAVSPHR
jgi:hypothetical protein